MKRLLFALLIIAIVPIFADNVSFVYYGYNYDPGYYDEYWYSDYWYDGYWMYMPYGYYCVRFIWWYPWWWDWYWARCHWCHHFQWDFFYAGFYVVWYDHGTWWYRPRYGQYVRYRLPYSYAVLRVRARTNGIYLPDKPPREINLPYHENQVMRLARKHDPELFARVERENRTGNLERMRTKYMNQVNNEIAAKNREHGIESRRIDIKELANRKKSIAWTSSENPVKMKQRASDVRQPDARVERSSEKRSSEKGSSRIKTERRSESKKLLDSKRSPAERVERKDSKEKRTPPSRVTESRDKTDDQPKVAERGRASEKSEKRQPTNKKETSRPERQSERKSSAPRHPIYNRTNASESER
ncbi:MAG: hypothetical protein JSU64_01000 [candidate division WOR-3 bacterium]|nr:MAG: hypothetical protein JSU64_01000 [candidate division WOR-3 bacterium]